MYRGVEGRPHIATMFLFVCLIVCFINLAQREFLRHMRTKLGVWLPSEVSS